MGELKSLLLLKNKAALKVIEAVLVFQAK